MDEVILLKRKTRGKNYITSHRKQQVVDRNNGGDRVLTLVVDGGGSRATDLWRCEFCGTLLMLTYNSLCRQHFDLARCTGCAVTHFWKAYRRDAAAQTKSGSGLLDRRFGAMSAASNRRGV